MTKNVDQSCIMGTFISALICASIALSIVQATSYGTYTKISVYKSQWEEAAAADTVSLANPSQPLQKGSTKVVYGGNTKKMLKDSLKCSMNF